MRLVRPLSVRRCARAALALVALTACSKAPSESPPPAGALLTLPSGPHVEPPPAVAAPPAAPPIVSARADAQAPREPTKDLEGDALAATTPIDWKNEVKYVAESEELTERARSLFEAIVRLEPDRAEAFWFPKEPFVPLKDVKNPGRYWDNLHRAYLDDVRALHRKRKSWDNAVFERFTVGSPPKWVKPGDEVNKIGYYRSFHGTIHYRINDKPATIDVHTIITWQGRWYVTHLRKLKKS